MNDAVLALISLGYKQVDAHKAVKQAQEKGGAVQTRGSGAGGAEALDMKRRTSNVEHRTPKSEAEAVLSSSMFDVRRSTFDVKSPQARFPDMVSLTIASPPSARLPARGLFADKDWLLSPEPFVIDAKLAEQLDKLG